jgi:hypothetical protein
LVPVLSGDHHISFQALIHKKIKTVFVVIPLFLKQLLSKSSLASKVPTSYSRSRAFFLT